jgi:hypothetical protein
MEHLSNENRTLIQAAINAVNIQLSGNSTVIERTNAGKVCDKELKEGSLAMDKFLGIDYLDFGLALGQEEKFPLKIDRY